MISSARPSTLGIRSINRRLRRVLDYIEEHLADDIAVADLAKVACLSAFHFTHVFSAAIGMPPHRYVSQRRLERAKAMIAAELKSTELGNPVDETLTALESEILALIGQGFSNKIMAQFLKISPATVSSLGVHTMLRFGPFELSASKRVLRRDGVALPLGSRAFDILVYLAERPGEVIGKQELIDHVWSNVTVEEGSLRVHVVAIRKALGDGQFGTRYIANVKGRGYSFIGSVVRLEDGTEHVSERPQAS